MNFEGLTAEELRAMKAKLQTAIDAPPFQTIAQLTQQLEELDRSVETQLLHSGNMCVFRRFSGK